MRVRRMAFARIDEKTIDCVTGVTDRATGQDVAEETLRLECGGVRVATLVDTTVVFKKVLSSFDKRRETDLDHGLLFIGIDRLHVDKGIERDRRDKSKVGQSRFKQ